MKKQLDIIMITLNIISICVYVLYVNVEIVNAKILNFNYLHNIDVDPWLLKLVFEIHQLLLVVVFMKHMRTLIDKCKDYLINMWLVIRDNIEDLV